MTTWTDQSKNSSSYSDSSKSSSTWTDQHQSFVHFLLVETGGFLLLEDGGRIILEPSNVSTVTWTDQTKN